MELDWLTEPLTQAFNDLVTILPAIVAFIAILLIGRFIAKLIEKGVGLGLRKIKFDDVMDKAGLGGPLENAGFADSGMFIAKIIYYGLMLLVLQMALNVFGPNPVTALLERILAFLPKAIVAIAIIIITGVVANAVRKMIQPALESSPAGDIMGKVVTAIIWFFGIFAALDVVDIATGITSTLFDTIIGSLGLILVIKFGIGGIWAAKERFWPAFYDGIQENFGSNGGGTPTSSAPSAPSTNPGSTGGTPQA